MTPYSARTMVATTAPVTAAHRRLPIWGLLMLVGAIAGAGFALWPGMTGPADGAAGQESSSGLVVAVAKLVAGLLIVQGACEALVQATERLGARLRWDGYIAGTIAAILATLPEFVVIALLVAVEPLVAFIVAVVTTFNNGLIFAVYSFFLPKDRQGQFVMPAAISRAGSEVLVAGGGIALVLGLSMLALRGETHKTEFSGADLILIAAVLFVVFGYYTFMLVKYFAEGDPADHPEDPHDRGHPTHWPGILGFLALGIGGAIAGGDLVSEFADSAINTFHLPDVPTALGLAFFGGLSEYLIVYKTHRRGELGIALANVYAGITQVMFLVVPFTLLVVGLFGIFGTGHYAIPITFTTTMVILLLFPLMYVLLEYTRHDHTFSNLDAAAMTGIYILLLYVLLFISPATAA